MYYHISLNCWFVAFEKNNIFIFTLTNIFSNFLWSVFSLMLPKYSPPKSVLFYNIFNLRLVKTTSSAFEGMEVLVGLCAGWGNIFSSGYVGQGLQCPIFPGNAPYLPPIFPGNAPYFALYFTGNALYTFVASMWCPHCVEGRSIGCLESPAHFLVRVSILSRSRRIGLPTWGGLYWGGRNWRRSWWSSNRSRGISSSW